MKKKIKCETCNTLNPSRNIYCSKCTRYLRFNNVNLKQTKEFDAYISSLKKICKSLSNKITTKKNLNFKELLSLYWLRPETALLYALESKYIKKYFKKNYKIGDIGCGNGVYTSYLNGFKFKKNFDAFNNIDLKNLDFYNSNKIKLNKFDCFKRRAPKIELGLDINSNMIKLSKNLNSFKNLICGDALNINYKSGNLDLIYSNSIRDFNSKNLNLSLKECNRLLKNKGKLILSVPTPYYKKMLYFKNKQTFYKNSNKIYLANIYKKLDNGRSIFCRQQISLKKWSSFLKKNNFIIIRHHDYMSENLLRFWDIGLRKIFPLIFSQLENKIHKIKIKKKFINYFENLLNYHIHDDMNKKKHGFRTLICQKIG